MIGLDPSSNRFGRIAQRSKTRRSGWVRCPRRSTRSSNLAVCGRDRRDRAAGKRRSSGARHLLTNFGGAVFYRDQCHSSEATERAGTVASAAEFSPAQRGISQTSLQVAIGVPELDERLGRSVGLVAALG
jgi:hypothetical protein